MTECGQLGKACTLRFPFLGDLVVSIGGIRIVVLGYCCLLTLIGLLVPGSPRYSLAVGEIFVWSVC